MIKSLSVLYNTVCVLSCVVAFALHGVKVEETAWCIILELKAH